MQSPAYPHLQWIGIETGEGAVRVGLTCLIGIVAPLLAGVSVWRYATQNFDRLVGRPWKDGEGESVSIPEGQGRMPTA